MYKRIINVLACFLIVLIISFLFNNMISLASETKEITIKYLDEEGNEIKPQEVTQIEMGEEEFTKYNISNKYIPGGTNIFPPSISEYKIKSCTIKTYYNGIIREGRESEIAGGYLETSNHRVAITSPKSSDTYILEFIYKKSNTFSFLNTDTIEDEAEINDLDNDDNSITENEDSNLQNSNETTNKKKVKKKYSNNTITNNQETSKTDKNIIYNIIFIIVVMVISIFTVVFSVRIYKKM